MEVSELVYKLKDFPVRLSSNKQRYIILTGKKQLRTIDLILQIRYMLEQLWYMHVFAWQIIFPQIWTAKF